MIGTPEELSRHLWSLDKDKQYEIKPYKKRRSNDANSYCWVLCKKIADVIGNTKEFVYREHIRAVGTFEILPVKNEAVERFIDTWESKGYGWLCEVFNKSKIDGYTNIIAYYGSSTYDNKEMSILIDDIIYQAKLLNIETLTPEEIENLKNSWRA